VERCRGGLEPEAGDQHREPRQEQVVVAGIRVRDRPEAELTGCAVDECRAEEQDRRAEAADDQVLQPCLQRRLAMRVERAEDVEGDREPLEPRKSVIRLPAVTKKAIPAPAAASSA
jgi:hypothetical protein